jgi:AbiV family abortive infection protein
MGSSRKSVGEILKAMGEAQSVAVMRELAAACFANARSHHEAAVVLYENDHAPTAVALAVLGVEEFAKAVLYTAVALFPSERDVLGEEARWHAVKHLIAIAAQGAQCDNEPSWAVGADYEGAWPSLTARLESMFASLLRGGVQGLVTRWAEAREYFEGLRREYPDFPVTPDKKNDALYVDLSPTGEVWTPARVATWAEFEILGLRWYLDEFRALPEVLEEDERWKRFAESVGEVRRSPLTPEPGGSKGSP